MNYYSNVDVVDDDEIEISTEVGARVVDVDVGCVSRCV